MSPELQIGQLWGIVLAAGEGTRVRSFLTELCGGRGIKQFCAVMGGRSGQMEACTGGECRDSATLGLPGVQEELVQTVVTAAAGKLTSIAESTTEAFEVVGVLRLGRVHAKATAVGHGHQHRRDLLRSADQFVDRAQF